MNELSGNREHSLEAFAQVSLSAIWLTQDQHAQLLLAALWGQALWLLQASRLLRSPQKCQCRTRQ